jgi:hypothetical protein
MCTVRLVNAAVVITWPHCTPTRENLGIIHGRVLIHVFALCGRFSIVVTNGVGVAAQRESYWIKSTTFRRSERM